MAMKVAINGFGTIGKRVADAVAAQADMEIVGVTKTGPSFGCELAVRRGFPLYCTSDDVGRVAEIGTVEVTQQFAVERYSHVMHISSQVEAKLASGKTAMDVLRATLPVGTLSGAPKIRAMEIIDELEPVKRGIYGGAVGYLAWNGNMDTAIAIRTAVIKDGVLYIEAGGGIVADSVPRLEWKESMNKGRAIFQAVQLVESGFQDNE